MRTLQQKLAALLRNIQNDSYSKTELANMVGLQEKIAKDIDCDDSVEAMALLGYLLKYKYVTIDPKKGIVLNPEKSRDIDLLLQE